VISYTDITFNTVPEGAAVIVDGQNFGYSPVVIHARLENGHLAAPLLITAVATAPGEFTQHGSLGLWDYAKTYGPTETITAYMYDSTGVYARAAQLNGGY
jgi:hypothetical protein